ncbi:alpha-L-rhamnosidase [Ereboglobus luteus]|nr:alpha-L-rhamnosidase [Ereboglobus luteus]
MKNKPALILIFALVLSCAALGAATIRPVEPRCEHRDNPLGLRETWPRLTWRLEAVNAADRGLSQSAWQILVASSPEKLKADEGDIWDSGRVTGADVRAVFAGRKLDTLQQVWWKVRVWDGGGLASGWSETATWSRGLEETVTLQDWPGGWIGLDPDDRQRNENLTDAQRERAARRMLKWVTAVTKDHQRPAQSADGSKAATALTAWFKKSFHIKDKPRISRAVIWLVPDMECEVWVNGERAGAAARWNVTRQIDIGSFLINGNNLVALRVTQDDGNAPAVFGEIEMFIPSGTRREPIDGNWLAALSDAARPDAPELAGDDTWSKPEAKTRLRSFTNGTHYYAPAAMLRKEFSVGKPVRRALLVATAAGVYEAEINGRRVGHDFFSPGWTEYRRRLHAQTYDVTALLNDGANAIGITLADGWFSGTVGAWGLLGKRQAYGGFPRARALLVIEHDDGSVTQVPTDSSWKASFGPIRYADLMQGCGYDARLDMPGWTLPGFDDAKWKKPNSGEKPRLADGPRPFAQTVIEGATLDGVRITETLPARSVRKTAPGTWLVDFGQNFVGWARLNARGTAGTHVIFRHGEILNPDGTLHTTNLRGAAQVDEFWMRDGEQVLEPRFTFHGFRYLEVRGLEHEPSATDFTGIVTHTPIKRTGWFECSNPLLNQLYSNIIWSQRGNHLEIPTDCPQRDERLGWTGDIQFFGGTSVYNYDMRALLERWLETLIADSQNAAGTFPGNAPAYPGYHMRPSSGWGDAAIVVPYILWRQYGETRPIERHFDALLRYMDWLERRSRDGIVVVRSSLGDWLNKGGTAKKEVIDTAFYAYVCDLMSQMAALIGRDAEAARFQKLHKEVRAAFEREFLLADGSIFESSQTGYALAFTMGLVPEHLREKMSAKFNDSIEAFDWHLATGFIGTARLMPALFNAGLDDTAWRVLLQESYPSWLYQVKLGATTMWEAWDGFIPETGRIKGSLNHYAFGAVGESFYRHIAGINTATPGFRDIVIRPRLGGGLTHARAAYEAVTGRVESGWEKLPDGGLALDVTIPVGSRARIFIPARAASAVTESGRALGAAPGVRVLTSEISGEVVCETGSGVYRFEVKP